MAHVLIAEDDRDQREMLCDILRDEGYSVDVASDGVEALQMLKGNVYDVALFDLRMPKKDGLTALQELRQGGYTKPIILLSAFVTATEAQRYTALGAAAALPKPYEVKELLGVIEAVVKSARGSNT